jgi:hypothetical protein
MHQRCITTGGGPADASPLAQQCLVERSGTHGDAHLCHGAAHRAATSRTVAHSRSPQGPSGPSGPNPQPVLSRRLVLQERSHHPLCVGRPAPCTSRTQPLAPSGPKPVASASQHPMSCTCFPPTRAAQSAPHHPLCAGCRSHISELPRSQHIPPVSLPAHPSCLAPSTSLLSRSQHQPSPHPSRWG